MKSHAAPSVIVLVVAAGASVGTTEYDLLVEALGPRLSVAADAVTTGLIVIDFSGAEIDEELTP